MIALRSFVGARENCRRYGVALPAASTSGCSLACDFARDMQRPDGTIPALSDSDSGDYRELLALAARVLERPELRRPPNGPASFPDGGYFVQRAGDRYLIFDCGPLGDGGHGHYDALSIEAWAGERRARARPRPLHLRRGRAEPAPLVPRHRRPQHGHASTAPTRRRTRARARRSRRAEATLPRPRDARRARRAQRRGPLARLRGRAPAARDLRRRRLLDRRGPPDRRRAATASTCAGTSRPGARTCSRRRRVGDGVGLAIDGARGDRARGRLDLAAPTASREPAPVVSAVATARARRSSPCSPRAIPARPRRS